MSGAKPASYLSLLVNLQQDWRYFYASWRPKLKKNTHEQTTDTAGMLSSALGICKKSNSGQVDIN